MFKTLTIEQQQSIAYVWMNRPEVHNAFNAEVIHELNQAFTYLDTNPNVRVVVLAGRGKSFSAGADLNWMKAAGEASEGENFTDAKHLALMLHTIAHLTKPTIACVQGAAFGGGMGLACACDICIAAEEASFATTEVKFGIIPATISPYVLRAIGERQAYRYFQTAERIPAAKAFTLGIAHEVVPSTALDDKVAQVIQALLQGGPNAQAASKALIRSVANHTMSKALLDDTAQRIASLRSMPEAREGLAAFLEKRAPAWISPKDEA